jgi:hypothetical protein
MVTVHLVLVILALVCFLFAAVNIAAPRGNLMAAGLFLWLLATLVGTGGRGL